ncbi:hypothetical protein RCH13_001630 [Chryseobacterium sp. MP_3.2]|nr:hypothetical protein [Chryseobacterium sp. MP_3.2]
MWLSEANPTEIRTMPLLLNRIENVKSNRLLSNRETTRKDAQTTMLFGENRHDNTDYLALPEFSSENRNYIPVGYVNSSTIASNKIYMIPNASLFSFGIMSSKMQNSCIKFLR